MNNEELIERLNDLTTEIQSLIQIAKSTPSVNSRGWVMTPKCAIPYGKAVEDYADRHGCLWNEAEARDLLKGWLDFTSVTNLSMTHLRSEHSIRAQLQRLLGKADVPLVIDHIIEKSF